MYNGFSKVTIVVSLEGYNFNKGSKLTDKSALVYFVAEHNQLKIEKRKSFKVNWEFSAPVSTIEELFH